MPNSAYLVKGFDCLADKLYTPQRWVRFGSGPWHRIHPLCKTRYTLKTTKLVCKDAGLEDGVMYLMTYCAQPRDGDPVCGICAAKSPRQRVTLEELKDG